jgi:S1-C subfamily serine protease/pSer/pThr/pTyr-binding forkhead associated (FHA) protein
LSIILTIRHLAGSLSGKSQRIALQEGQVLRLGRAPENDLRFSETADDSVSSLHAELSFDGQRLWVEDKKSTNGTFVNGAPCPPFEKVVVPDGSRIRLAKQGPEMQVVVETARAGAAAGTATATGAAATATGAAPKQSVGRETLLREIDRARQEERDAVGAQIAGTRRSSATLLAAGLAGVLLLGAGGFGGWAWWNGKKTAEREALADQQRQEELKGLENVWADVEQKVSPAVVFVRTSYRIRATNGNELTFKPITGSGVQIGPGLVLTARHVVEPWRFTLRDIVGDERVDCTGGPTWNWDEFAERHSVIAEHDVLEVQFPGQQPLKATLASGTGPRAEDLALLRIQQTTAPVVPLGPANNGVKVTEEVAIMGYPGGLGQYAVVVSNATGIAGTESRITEVVPTFINGKVTQPLTSTGPSSHLLLFNAPIEHGNSGGPVVNRKGELIGIVSLRFNSPGQVVNAFGLKVPTCTPMDAGSAAVSPDDILSFLRKHGIV